MMNIRNGLLAVGFLWATSGQAAANAAKPQDIEFRTVLVDGKKTWVPALTTLAAKGQVNATLINELAEPHGFEIPGVVKPVVVEPKKPTKVSFTLDAAGDYDVKCHLHPAHVGAKLSVK
jgi:plastocyanin